VGLESEGLATAPTKSSPKNMDYGEDELKGSLAAAPNVNKNIKLKSINTQNLGNAGMNVPTVKESEEEAIAPSPLNTFSAPKNAPEPPKPGKNIKEEAELVTSLASPVLPSTTENDTLPNESISNNLTVEQKVGGRRTNGGSLYSAMARTTYTLAPAAALLATAALVIRGKKRRTRKHLKKSRKTHRRR